MKDLIKGAYDLHVHSGPDILPRKMDDIEMAQRIMESGMSGYAIKSHYFNTAERASLVKKMYPEVDVIGAITLNMSVGGVNPTAVEMAARSGAKIVWFPTTDSAYEMAHQFDGDPNRKLPYWAKIIIQLKEEGIQIPTIELLDKEGKLKQESIDVIDVIAKYDIILATSHSSHEETFELVRVAKERGVKKIIVTHVDFPTTYYTVEEQKALLSEGVYMEHCYTTWKTGKVPFETTVEMIREIGPDHVILSTDLGQTANVYPDEGLLEFCEKLVEEGFTKEDIKKMVVLNPRKLLNLEEGE